MQTISIQAVSRLVSLFRGRGWLLGGLAAGSAVAAALAEGWTKPILAVSFAMGLVAVFVRAVIVWSDWKDRAASRALRDVMADDAAPTVLADREGRIVHANPAALRRFAGSSIAAAIGPLIVDAEALQRLTAGALTGGAVEDFPTARGVLRLSVMSAPSGCLLWRCEEFRTGEVTAGLPVLSATPQGRIVQMNDAMRRLLAGRPARLDGLLPAAFRQGEEVSIRTGMGERRLLAFEERRDDGRREICLVPLDGRSEAVGDGGFEELPVALLWLAVDGRVLSANRAAREMLCLPDGPVLLHDLVGGLGRPLCDWISDAMAGRGLNRPEVLRASRTETEFYVEIVLRRVVEDGRPGLVAVLNDATEHQNLQSQFIQSQKMQAIGQLAGGVAHDFNNLLTAISGHCDLLLLRHRPGDPEFADLEQIRQNSDRAAGLVRQLLAYSRKQTLQSEVLDLREVLSDATHLLNRLVGERVRLTFSHDDRLRPIRADRRQLDQVIMNLVVNARDAVEGAGEIRVETEACRLRRPLERDRAVVPAGEYSLIRVRDAGVGIPPERLEKIFEPFFTTKRPGEGTGLGLSTVYGIVKQSGAFIFVDSISGEGTTFSLYFPVHVPAPDGSDVPTQESEKAVTTVSPGRSSGIILLVEDEAPVRAFAARALRLKGFTVLEAENGEAALELVSDPALRVDVIVTDVIMPGIDGPTWVRQALVSRPDMRVIFVSGYAEDSFSDIRSRIPNSVFLPKPFSLAQLTTTVDGEVAKGPPSVPVGGTMSVAGLVPVA